MASYYRLKQVVEQEPRVLPALLRQKQHVLCRHNGDDRQKYIRIDHLYANNRRFYTLEHSKWDYFVRKDAVDSIRHQLYDTSGGVAGRERQSGPSSKGSPGDSGDTAAGTAAAEAAGASADAGTGNTNFGEEYERIEELESVERTELLRESRDRLEELRRNPDRSREETAEALVDTARDAALVNRASMLEAIRMGNEEAKAYTRDIVEQTQELVRGSMELITDDIFEDPMIRDMVAKSNGTVVQHMTRVYLNGLSFMLWYNRQLLTSSLANRIRVSFTRNFAKRYRPLLPSIHGDDISLERVFLGGMQALSEQQLSVYATGFLVHDVGKVEDIEYHEGEEGFDRETVERHVKLGYTAVMNKTSYPREAGLITGYHHEYYGHPSGYGYFREFLDRYRESNPQARIEYVMSYQMEPLIDYVALSYFPAKVLEVVDVFDSLTDPNRKYRSPLSQEDAIEVMQEQFVEKNLKLDPILFTLFRQFSGL